MTSPKYFDLPTAIQPYMPVQDYPTSELLDMLIAAVIARGSAVHPVAVEAYIVELRTEILGRATTMQLGDVQPDGPGWVP